MNITKISKYLGAKFILVLALFVGLATAAENERHIHINGEHLDLTNIQLLDQIVGSTVGDGYYWLNIQTGQWGFEGNNQTQGIIAALQIKLVLLINKPSHIPNKELNKPSNKTVQVSKPIDTTNGKVLTTAITQALSVALSMEKPAPMYQLKV